MSGRVAADGRPPPRLGRLVPVPARRDAPPGPASDLVGTDLAGNPVTVSLEAGDGRALLVFVSSGCDGCRPFWPAAANPSTLGIPPGEPVVLVTHDRRDEDPAALARLVCDPAGVVMSNDAWRAYRVQGPPFFALVDRSAGRVVTEGVAWAVAQVAADVRRAIDPAPRPEG
ncbi:MAG: TlpA family protein disulfide reductase [Acidimicrobiales bacterium]